MFRSLTLCSLLLALSPVVRADESKADPLQVRGTVQPVRLVSVSSGVPGRVVEVLRREGDKVKAGEVLFRLDDKPAQAARRVAEARVKAAEARVGTARQQGELAVLRAELEVARAELEQASLTLDRHVVVAPFEGVVLRVNVEEGTSTNPQMFGLAISAGLCELADVSALFVGTQVSEAESARLAVGQPCEVRLDSHPKQALRGKVDRVSAVVDRGSVAVRVKLDDRPEHVRINAAATVRFLAKP